MADQHTLGGFGEFGQTPDPQCVDSLRSTADDNLVILLNGEMVFGKMDGQYPRPTPHVLAGSIVPRRPMASSPAIVSRAGVRQAAAALARDDTIGSEIFDQSSVDAPGEDLSYEHARPISPIGDVSMGSMKQLAREIDLMEGSYFSSGQKQAGLPETASSILSARGVASMQEISSSDEDADEMPERYMLSKPYRANSLQDDWVKAWGEAWGLKVNRAEEQKRTKRLSALQDKRKKGFWGGQVRATHIEKAAKSSPEVLKAVQGEGPSILRAMDTSVAKAAANVGGSPPPHGPKSPWANRTTEQSSSEGGPKTPLLKSSVDDSVASAERTVQKKDKSKWLFGDAELTEDEDDEQLGEENHDGEEPWTRSAKKQHRSIETSRLTMPRVQLEADRIRQASGTSESKNNNPHTIRKHSMSLRERAVVSGDEQDNSEISTSPYTPDLTKLRLAREKRTNCLIDDADDYRPLFRRADGRLVRKLCAEPTSPNASVAPLTLVDLGHSWQVGAWV